MITHVAIMHQGVAYSLPAPNRHHHIIQIIYLATGLPVDDEIQGFLDDRGRFLDREQAFQHAVRCGQLKVQNFRSDVGWLYSEHLW